MNYDAIGKFIQMRRKEKGLTQKELANKIGVTDKAVSKWETGLGCPDTAILEILSKELDCSILELLKGREIKEEVIPVTEMDDYIKDSIQYGENSVKKVISNIIALMAIFTVAVLYILNITNMYNQRKQYVYDHSISKRLVERVNIINKNIDIIKKHQGKYTKEDYGTIILLLEKTQKEIDSNPYIDYSGDYLTINDLYMMDTLSFGYANNLSILRLLTKYDSSYETTVSNLVESIGTRMFLGSAMTQNIYDLSYKYQIIYKSIFDISDAVPAQAREYDIYYRLGLYIDTTNAIIEVGDIHE